VRLQAKLMGISEDRKASWPWCVVGAWRWTLFVAVVRDEGSENS
jgi:hypothetical protein